MCVLSILQDKERYQVYEKGKHEISHGYFDIPKQADKKMKSLKSEFPDREFGIYDLIRGRDIK